MEPAMSQCGTYHPRFGGLSCIRTDEHNMCAAPVDYIDEEQLYVWEYWEKYNVSKNSERGSGLDRGAPSREEFLRRNESAGYYATD